jgi:hypothetical protein
VGTNVEGADGSDGPTAGGATDPAGVDWDEVWTWVGRLAVVVAGLGGTALVLWFFSDRAGITCATRTHPATSVLDLEVAGSEARSAAVLRGCTQSEVRGALWWDFPFIALYATALAIVAARVAPTGYRVKSFRGRSQLVRVAAVAAGAFDVVENLALLVGLRTSPLRIEEWPARVAVVVAWSKFALVALAVAYAAGALMGWVVHPGWVKRALRDLDARRKTAGAEVGAEVVDPPHRPDRARWAHGITLSGGGVRSASFGLGGLQGLEHQKAGTALRWQGASVVTSISGGSYMAGGWSLARTPRADRSTAPAPCPDAWRRPDASARHKNGMPVLESLEEQHLRDHLGYLLESDPRGGRSPSERTSREEPDTAPRGGRSPSERTSRSEHDTVGVVATLVVGLAVNVATLLLILWVVARPVGWLVGSCAVEPSLQVPRGSVGIGVCAVSPGFLTRTFSAGPQQALAPTVWLVLAGALLASSVLAGRVRRTGPLTPVVRKLRPLAGAAGALGAVLGIVLVVIPWALIEIPNAFSRIGTETPAPSEPSTFGRVLVLLSSLGVVTSVVALLTDRLKRLAPKLGGVALLVVALLVGGQIASDAAVRGSRDPEPFLWTGSGTDLSTYLIVAVTAFVAALLLCPEWWSMAPFYRGRLRRAYATFRDGSGSGAADAYSGGDAAEDHPEPSLHELAPAPGTAPVTRICAAMTISDRSVRTHAGIPAGSVTFDPGEVAAYLPLGDDGYSLRIAAPPQKVEALMHRWDNPRLTTMAAVGVSGAAVSPAMGRFPIGTTKSLLAFANLRLGVWIPNPRYARLLGEAGAPPGPGGPGGPGGPSGRSGAHRAGRWLSYPRVHLTYLLKELVGIHDPDDLYVYVSDGGTWENTGVVEMTRSGQVDEIVCLDASGVAVTSTTALAEAIGLAPLECAVRIDIDLDPVWAKPDSPGAAGYAERPVALGTITYLPRHDQQHGPIGLLWYAKPTLCRDTPSEQRAFHERYPKFPATSTADQFFDTEQFENYRALGRDAARRIVLARAVLVDAVRHADTLEDLRASPARQQDHGWAVGELADLLASEGDYGRLRDRLLHEEDTAAGGIATAQAPADDAEPDDAEPDDAEPDDAEPDDAAAEPGAGADPG